MFLPAQFQIFKYKALRNAVLAGICVAAVSLFISNKYISEARILPADARGSAGGLGQMALAAAAVGVNIPGQDSSDAAFVDIVNSRWLQKKLLLEKYKFRTRSWLFVGWTEHEETLYDFLGAKNIDRGLGKMKGMINVKRDLKTKLLTITVETLSPELSQQIVHNAVSVLEEFIQEKSRTRGSNKAVFTAQRLKEAQTLLAQSEQEITGYLSAHRNFATSNDPSIRLMGARLENILKLRQQVVTTLSLNYEQALLEEKNDMQILNVLDDGDQPLEKSSPQRALWVLASMLAAAGATFGWALRGSINSFILGRGNLDALTPRGGL